MRPLYLEEGRRLTDRRIGIFVIIARNDKHQPEFRKKFKEFIERWKEEVTIGSIDIKSAFDIRYTYGDQTPRH